MMEGRAPGSSIEFPCEAYPISVIAWTHEDLVPAIVEIVCAHDAHFEDRGVTVKRSRRGRYSSVRLSIRATGEPQLKALHRDLLSHPLVRLVL